jgi:hypothetical protein
MVSFDKTGDKTSNKTIYKSEVEFLITVGKELVDATGIEPVTLAL